MSERLQYRNPAFELRCPFCLAAARLDTAQSGFHEGTHVHCACGAQGVATCTKRDLQDCIGELVRALQLDWGHVVMFAKLARAAEAAGFEVRMVDDDVTLFEIPGGPRALLRRDANGRPEAIPFEELLSQEQLVPSKDERCERVSVWLKNQRASG